MGKEAVRTSLLKAERKRNMVCELKETKKAGRIFAGWEETMIRSCLQGVMGGIYCTDPEEPASALAYLGCFGFFAGEPCREMFRAIPKGFSILTPQNEAWAEEIEAAFPQAKKVMRYAFRKDTRFDTGRLRMALSELPAGYEIRRIDADLYERCLDSPVTEDFVSCFGSKERFLELGLGMVIVKDGRIVSGASSYTRYREGIEIEVDTVPEERRKHLAYSASAALILECLQRGWYPSWDAQNPNSVHLAEKLGYVSAGPYTAYEVTIVP